MGQRTARKVISATPIAIAPTQTSTPAFGADAQRQNQQGRAGDDRNRDRNHRSAAAGKRRLGCGRSPEQVGGAREHGHDPGGGAEARAR